MAIHNVHGQTSYRRTMPRGYPGQPAEARLPDARSYRVPKRKQITNIAISGFGANDDSITVNIEMPSGEVLPFTVTRVAGTPADDAAAAEALADLINESSGVGSARGVVVASTNAANLILTFVHEGYAYEVTTSVVAAVAAVTETQSPSGTPVPIARFVALASDAAINGQRAIQLPVDADAEDICGITLRTLTPHVNLGSADPDDDDMIQPGSMADVAYEGAVLMVNHGSAAAAERDRVWVIVDSDSPLEVGQAMGVPTAAESGTLQVATVTPGAAQNSVPVSVEVRILTGPRAGASKVLSFVTDADMTATEVANAFRSDFDDDPIMTGVLTSSGTATFILTSDRADTTFEVNVLQGTFTIDNATVAADGFAVELPTCYWAEDTPAGALGKVFLRL